MNLYLEQPHPCAYLPDQTCQNLIFNFRSADETITEQLLASGFRHFGSHWFIPACPECSKCRGIFINTIQFSPSKSQRKLINKNRDLRIERSRPSVTAEKVDLINRFHASQSDRIGWREQFHDEEEYFDSFVKGNLFCEEYRIYDEQKLVGVGLLDLAGNRASSIYFYYDPEYRHRSLGTWSVISEIIYCQTIGVENLHLGLWNESCQSLAYKNRFLPNSLLDSLDIINITNKIRSIFENRTTL